MASDRNVLYNEKSSPVADEIEWMPCLGLALFFAFFFLSGFCSLVYQVVWLRVAMADFGVTTPLVSIVLSVFMAGLAAGSWFGGRMVRRNAKRSAAFFVVLYALCELAIGVSGIAVRPLLSMGHLLLAARGDHAAWGSSIYYLASGGWIALVLLPFCTCMGATFPIAMAGIRRSFSYLYIANVLGAMAGAFGSAFILIELLGFSRTLLVTAAVNGTIAALALWLAHRLRHRLDAAVSKTPGSLGGNQERLDTSVETADTSVRPTSDIAVLFLTGLCSLAMEVVWTRQFVPFLGPVVYSFATMLSVYLLATAIGSRIYRATRWRSFAFQNIALLAGCCGLLPLLAADPQMETPHRLAVGALRVALGIGPFCGVLGFLTPMLVDRWSGGDPDRAGKAYAVNALGSIAGPLIAGFWLLPMVGERWSLAVLSLPFLLLGWQSRHVRRMAYQWVPNWPSQTAASIAAILVFGTRGFESLYPNSRVLRDYTATVIATGRGMDRKLLVNGIGITNLTPITKMMAHLTLASVDSPPRNVLVLCFGMGTSFRSALSWGVPVTAVELVPSVPSLFSYFHSDADALLASPRATIVIDDARRFLERTGQRYDAIVIDPPPPIEAAGSSLLYSREFYALAASRLAPGGILQQWLPRAEPIVISSVARSLAEAFSHVRAFHSIEGWGLHFLASESPLTPRTAAELAQRMPPSAVTDLLEWGPQSSAEAQFQPVVAEDVPLKSLTDAVPAAPILTDDRPVNEYYFLRRTFRKRPVSPGSSISEFHR